MATAGKKPPDAQSTQSIHFREGIDANGIVHVSAKDMGTGKEQSIEITASSGLTEEEIQNLVRDAELHADEDKQKRELVDARNTADSMIYSTEKSISEAGDNLDEASKENINQAIENLKKVMEGDNAEEIKRLSDELTQASHKLAEAMYANATQQQEQTGGAAGPETGPDASKDDDVVDADFEEVKK